MKKIKEILSKVTDFVWSLKERVMSGRKHHQVVEVMVPMFDMLCDKGVVEVGTGVNTIEIKTNSAPKKVWFSFEDEGCAPVCVGDVDRIGVSLLHDGFLLHSYIVSNSRKIRWVAVL